MSVLHLLRLSVQLHENDQINFLQILNSKSKPLREIFNSTLTDSTPTCPFCTIYDYLYLMLHRLFCLRNEDEQ